MNSQSWHQISNFTIQTENAHSGTITIFTDKHENYFTWTLLEIRFENNCILGVLFFIFADQNAKQCLLTLND